jgi:hypothetical protein
MTKQEPTEIEPGDDEVETFTIAKVEDREECFIVQMDDGFSLMVPKDRCDVLPTVGEAIRLYGKGVGYPVRGIVIAGRIYRYKTQYAAAIEAQEDVNQMKRERTMSYEQKRAEFDARVAALPEALRDRVERFRALGGNSWRYEFEPYELFCCEQGAVIAEALGDGRIADGKTFCDLDFKEQQAIVPKLSDQHSGNTFFSAVRLARILMERPDWAIRVHGSMCALTGCADAHCWAAHEGREEAAAS